MSNTVFKVINPTDGFARRLSFASAPSWAELAGKLENIYGIRKDDVCVSYTDSDGDEIVLSSDTELKEYFEEYASGRNVGQGDDSVRATRFTVMSLSAIRGGEEGSVGHDGAPVAAAFVPPEDAPKHAAAEELRDHPFANEGAAAEIESDGTNTVSSVDSDIEEDGMFFVLPFVGGRGRGRGHFGHRGHFRAFGGRGRGDPHHDAFHGHHHRHRHEPRGSEPIPHFHPFPPFMPPPSMPVSPLDAEAVPPPPPFGMFGWGRGGHHHGRGEHFSAHGHAHGRGGRFAPHKHARGRGGIRGHPYYPHFHHDHPQHPPMSAHIPPFPPQYVHMHGGFMMMPGV